MLIQEKSTSYNDPSQISSTRDLAALSNSLSSGIMMMGAHDDEQSSHVDKKPHTTTNRTKITSRLTYHSSDVNFRTYWTNRLFRSYSMDLDTSRRTFVNLLDMDMDSEDTESASEQLARYRLLKLDNTILVKSKDEYIYDVVHEKVFGSRSVRQMKAEGHRKMQQTSK